MRIQDLTVEVRDGSLTRVGQIVPGYLDLQAKARWCDVGEWKITLPGDHAMVPYLAAPGSGVIILGPEGAGTGTLLSGPTTTPQRIRNQQNPDGTYTFEGASDEILLLGAVAYPNPLIGDPQESSQSRANDTRTGKAEDLLRQFVAYNVAYTHAPARRVRGLRQRLRLSSNSQGRGITITKSPRFQNLLELLQEIILLDPSLGFRVAQVGGDLEFQVLSAGDKRGTVRFDIENGTVTSEQIAYSGPSVTEAIVAGGGEGTERLIISRTNAEATAAEAEWGIPWERFVDQRDTTQVLELQQSGDEALEEGRGGTAVKMVPSDDTTMLYGVDWTLGDLVTTIVDGQETTTRVTESVLVANGSAVIVGAGIGDLSGFTKQDAQGSQVEALDSRVSRLERASRDMDPGTLNPSGAVQMFAGATAPAGWLLCNGAAVSRSTYAALFQAIGTTFGGGNGSTTFNLPNFKGRAPVGLDAAQSEFDALGETGGAKTHTLTIPEMPAHTHNVANSAGGNGVAAPRGDFYGIPNVPIASTSTGGGGAHNNLQPYLTMNFIIKT